MPEDVFFELHRIKIYCMFNGSTTEEHLPTSFNAVEVLPKGSPQDPELRETEFICLLNLGFPHINGGLGSIVCIPLYITNCMLLTKTQKRADEKGVVKARKQQWW